MTLSSYSCWVSAFAVLCLATAPAAAADELSTGQISAQPDMAQSERLAYNLKIGGIHIADFLAEFDESDTSYRTMLTMETKGLARWFQDFRAEVTGFGTMSMETGRGPVPVPRQFDRAWAASEIAASLTIAYDPVTGLALPEERIFNPLTGEDIALEDMEWNRDRDPPPPVPDDLRMGVFDPMAAFVAARRHILNTGDNEFRIPIYDGRRRYDLVGEVEAPRSFWIKSQDVELVPVLAGIDPVFGFDEERMDRIREGRGRLLFSPDHRFIPVQVVLEGMPLPSVMNLTADCREDQLTCQQIAQPPTEKAEAN